MGLDRPIVDFDDHPHSSTPLSVDVVHEWGEVTIVARGSLDRSTVPVLTMCLKEIVRAFVHYPTLVVDLADVGCVDVAGMDLLLHVTEWAADRGVTLHLVGCNARLRRMLYLGDLLDGLDLIATEPGGSRDVTDRPDRQAR